MLICQQCDSVRPSYAYVTVTMHRTIQHT